MTYLASKRRRRRWATSSSGAMGLGDLPFGMFAPAVEQWRGLLTQYSGDLPVDFLLAWIERESGGNPCSWTSLRESGIFQLMYGDNLNVAGVTEGQLRAACIGETQQRSRDLSDEEKRIQVASGIRYVQWARDQARKKLAAVGVSWPESSADFWRVVKLVHAYPAMIVPWFAAATAILGRPPANWAELRSTISGFDGVLTNAEIVGGKANVGGGISPVTLAILGGLGVLGYLLSR